MDGDPYQLYTEFGGPVMDSLMQKISCTIAVVADPAASSCPETYMLQSLDALSTLITEKEGISAITVSALVALVRIAVTGPTLLHGIPAIIQTALSSAVHLQVATTRVPYFGNDWQATSYGFQMFPPINPAAAPVDIPSDNASELIFAVDMTHPKTLEYIRTWAVRFAGGSSSFRHHFILALWLPQNSYPSRLSSQLSSTPSSRHNSPVPSLVTFHRHIQ
ncbi:hypothetical protein R3P38DRAFT_3434154, partial [Favolaschia claudopus]